MKNLIQRSFIMLGIIALSLTACDKDNDDDNTTAPNPSATAADDNATAESYYDDMYRQMDEQASSNGEVNGRPVKSGSSSYITTAAGCVDSVRLTTTAGLFPMTLTIYFNGSVTCSDGRKRSGKLICTFSGRYRDVNSVVTITGENYHVDGNKIEGTKTITNNGLNGQGNLNYTINVSNGKVTTTSGSTITWQSTRNREWSAGQSTLLNISDDEYRITGSASGTSRSGESFTATITSALLVKMNCKFITQGTIAFTSGSGSFTLDYGNGVCDDKATVNVNGTLYLVTLK